ncbi:hypothetical protein [Azohydromonas australica]|uniref:hypothetical protein n=1 Tax=Azohydromonas australica TaxID=364039 RepID=UPI0004054C96|nr:hypothetical protein [Azohydromonas australica]
MTPSDASTPPAPSAARAAGSALAGHRIEAVLHAGPVFTVYRAVDALGIERVALKEYCPQAQCVRDAEGAPALRDPKDPAAHAAFEAGRAAFVDEMRRLSRLRLPGVVRVRDLIEAEGSLCALMPLLPGVPLDELPPSQNDEALHALLLSLVEPLAQLHAAGQVHGALHARQLLWSPGRAPVLLGLGSAARVLGVVPEPDDRAPELRTPDPQPGPAVGPWTDVYALAAMVMRQLSGRPWDDAAADIGVAALLEKALGPAGDAGKRHVLVKALQSSLESTPTRRPHHAGELRAQLVAAGVSRSAKGGAAPSPSQAKSPSGETGRASSRLPGAMARGGPEPAMPALRPDGSCVIPQTPRRRDDSRRNGFLVLALALGCVASGWWVRGLWSDEQDRQRIDRLLVGAANPPAWAAASEGSDPAGLPPLPPLPTTHGATALPPGPGEPSPLEALAEARAPAPPEARPMGASVARDAPPAVVEAPPVPAPVAATAVTAQRAPVAAAVQVPEPAAVAQTPALEKPLVSAGPPATVATAPQAAPVVPPPVAAAADKLPQEAAPSPARAQPPSAPEMRGAAQPASRPSAQAARSAESKASRSAKAPVKATASRAASTAPRAACGTQAKYALLQCMKRQCSQSSQRDHPQCQLLRENVISS